MNEIIGTADVKARLSEFISRVKHHKKRIIIASRGMPAAALISIADLYRLEALDATEAAAPAEAHPIMRAFGGWADRDDLDALTATIYEERASYTTRDIDL
jgi:prevent-host-death family protein